MLQDHKRLIKRSQVYIILILILCIITYVSLIIKYSFTKLPLGFSLLFFIIIIIIYLLFKNQRNFSSSINEKTQSPDELTNSEPSDSKESVTEDLQVDKTFIENLLKGITKKASKKAFAEKLLSNLIKNQQAEIGLIHLYNKKAKTYQVAATYAYLSEEKPGEFKSGEGINGQVVKNKKTMRINNVSETHLKAVSGLGEGKPLHLFIYPIILNNKVHGVVEMGSFTEFSKTLEEELTKFFKANSDKFLNIEDK